MDVSHNVAQLSSSSDWIPFGGFPGIVNRADRSSLVWPALIWSPCWEGASGLNVAS
jgi:hypothetical protein